MHVTIRSSQSQIYMELEMKRAQLESLGFWCLLDASRLCCEAFRDHTWLWLVVSVVIERGQFFNE